MAKFDRDVRQDAPLQAYDIVVDVMRTIGLEHTAALVGGDPRTYRPRATQVYRREGGGWRVGPSSRRNRGVNSVTVQQGESL
jgi:hypothetical protein